MLSELELVQVREDVVKNWPQLLRQEPEVGTTIEDILAEQFPRRDEFASLLNEFQDFRQETKQEFIEVKGGIAQLQSDVSANRRDIVGLKSDVAELKDGVESNRKEILLSRREIIKTQHTQEMMIKRMDGMQTWMDYNFGNLRNQKGQQLEDMVAMALRYGLENPTIKPESLRLQQKLVDTTGEVFYKGYTSEVDLMTENGELTVFEVKATAKVGDVYLFAQKMKLIAIQHPGQPVKGVLICLAARDEVAKECDYHQIKLVS